MQTRTPKKIEHNRCRWSATFITLLLWQTLALAQEDWPHYARDWSDPLFQARVQGVYDWIGSGPDRLETTDYTDMPLPFYRLSTDNRDLDVFPTRVPVDMTVAYVPPPKDWVDREALIDYMSGNAEIEPEFFRDRLEDGASADTYYLMGNVDFLQHRYADAIDHYEQALDQFSNFRLAYQNLAYAYYLSGNCEGALTASTEAIQLGALSARLRGLQGFCAMQAGNHATAAQAFAMTRTLDSNNAIWQALEVEALVNSGRFRLAESILENAISDSQSLAQHIDELLAIQRGEQDDGALLATLEIKKRMLELDASELAELNQLKIAQGVGHLIADDEVDVHLRADAPQLQVVASVLEARLTTSGSGRAVRLAESIDDQLPAVTDRAELSGLLVTQGRAEFQGGDTDRALETLSTVLENYPAHCQALLLAAQVYEERGAGEMADSLFFRARNSGADCESQTLLEQAEMALRRGEFQQAYALYSEDAQRSTIAGEVQTRWQRQLLDNLARLTGSMAN